MSLSHSRPPISHDDLRAHTRDLWPVPGSGETLRRWSMMSAISAIDLPLAKLVEPHHDAAAILGDLGAPPPGAGEIWAVWASEPPTAVLTATQGTDGWRLSGVKAFCSGASLVTHALVTAETSDGSRLFSIEVGSGTQVGAAGPSWSGPGMSRCGTVTLDLHDVPAQPVGPAGAYVDRPGFWLGAVGIAACWLGGARGVAATLERGSARLDAHGRAHLGAVRSALDTTDLAFEAAADLVDRQALSTSQARRLALSLRGHTAGVVESVVSHVGRATGPGPLAFDGAHAEHVADLQVFVRQHHAERDMEQLGSERADDV